MQSKLVDEIFRSTLGKPLTIHFINTYSIGLMYRNSNYRDAVSDDSIFLADGWPIILLAKIRGRKGENIEQMRGVNVMRAILAYSKPNSNNHYFIGSTPQNLADLKGCIAEHYPQANIVGVYSPPFTEGDEWIQKKSEDFKNSNSDFVWIGLGTPKQDILMSKIAECFPKAKAIFAVGAAFDFLTQNRREASQTIIALKLEWLYRLFQEPRRLWRRYTVFIFYFLLASRFVTFKNQ
jgi:N-acetylglucosaminyldiphosphoundecaprenol N-acetyl-beta-D-mannosaminyltransferase